MNKDATKQGRYLSLILRHKPEAGNLTLDKNGWAEIKSVTDAMGISRQELEEIVAWDDKGRYEFSNDKKKIRARQGHSINVDVELKKFVPNSKLYHGTIWTSVEKIMKDGLKPMSRLYVHLSKDTKTATKVGSRRGEPVILTIDAKKAHEDGIEFFVSNNEVILTKHIPTKYISLEK